MGCGSSSANTNAKPASVGGGGDYKDAKEFTLEADKKRRVYDKKKGFMVECGDEGVEDCDECMEDDPLFEMQDETTEEFGACRPWIGQIAEPDTHNEFNPAKPDEQWKLEYCYGYRSADSRNNLHYNCNNQAVYITACLGVVLD